MMASREQPSEEDKSPMPITLTPLPPSGKSRLPDDEITPDTIQAVDEGYEWCQVNDGRLDAEFADQDAADRFLKEARSYAYKREPRVVVSGNSTRKGHARFRVELYVKPETAADE